MKLPLLRVLITAVGGDLGQAILKALRLAERPLRLHGCDLDPHGIGKAFVDSYHTVPPAVETRRYPRALNSLCRECQIDVVIPASEPGIRLLAGLPSFPRLPCGAVVVCQSQTWLQRFGDKLACQRALAPHLSLVPFADGADPAEVKALVRRAGFPLVIKPRNLSGSRGVLTARNGRELRDALRSTAAPLVQQYIEEDGGEFTVGLFACETQAQTIAFRRELGGHGPTWSAETSADPQVLGYSRQVLQATRLVGSANLQVRKTQGRVYLVEINPRFSSMAAARALGGFKDVEWSIALARGETVPSPKAPFRHLRFRRFFHECIDLGDGFAVLNEWLPRHKGGAAAHVPFSYE